MGFPQFARRSIEAKRFADLIYKRVGLQHNLRSWHIGWGRLVFAFVWETKASARARSGGGK